MLINPQSCMHAGRRVIASRKHSGEKREMRIAEAKPIIEEMVSERLISDDAVRREPFCPGQACYRISQMTKSIHAAYAASHRLCIMRLFTCFRLLQVQREAIQAVEQDGIVFIDEIDKIVVSADLRYGAPPFPGLLCLYNTAS